MMRALLLALAMAALPASAAELAAADPLVLRMGRTAQTTSGALRFGYPGVRLSLAFTGRHLDMVASSSGQHSWLEVAVDGAAPQRIKIGSERATYKLVGAASPGTHRVEITHRAETWHGVVTVEGFQTDGALQPPPALPERRMLVLGDSVTCAEGAGQRSGKKDSSWTDPRNSYGMLAAQALNAQVHLVCHGGRGLVRSWNGRTDEHNLPDFYELAVADAQQPVKWDHSRYQPDLIVSAIGTNDFSTGLPEREAYVSAYVNFLRTLLANHPQARIVLTEGAILNGAKKRALTAYIAETVRRIGDARVSAVPSRHHPGDRQDAHPTGPQHAAMARELTPRLRRLMGW
jgi:lysophospholipase L1-like esterase